MPPENGCDLAQTQQIFRAAMTGRNDGDLPELLAPGMPPHISVARRVAVHRNTYFGALTEALAAAFPATEKLVGGRFFAAAARAFIEIAPPRAPVLAFYGGGFADFLGEFPPAQSVGYLADVARLEWARVAATFAADAAPLDPADAAVFLAAVPPGCVGDIVFAPHPAARLTQSPWAALTIWEAMQTDPPGVCDPAAGPERALLTRPDDQLRAVRLNGGEAALTAALLSGATLSAAAADAEAAAEPDFDLQATLATLLSAGAFCAVALKKEEENGA